MVSVTLIVVVVPEELFAIILVSLPTADQPSSSCNFVLPFASVTVVMIVFKLNAPEVWLFESTFLVKPKAEIMPVFSLSIISALAILKLPSESNVAVTPLPARKFIKPDKVVFWSIVYV